MDFVLPGTYSIVEMEHDLYTQALSITKYGGSYVPDICPLILPLLFLEDEHEFIDFPNKIKHEINKLQLPVIYQPKVNVRRVKLARVTIPEHIDRSEISRSLLEEYASIRGCNLASQESLRTLMIISIFSVGTYGTMYQSLHTLIYVFLSVQIGSTLCSMHQSAYVVIKYAYVVVKYGF